MSCVASVSTESFAFPSRFETELASSPGAGSLAIFYGIWNQPEHNLAERKLFIPSAHLVSSVRLLHFAERLLTREDHRLSMYFSFRKFSSTTYVWTRMRPGM